MSKGAPGIRYAEIERETDTTRVQVVLDIDGGTRRDISTGLPFLDQMLRAFAKEACIDVGIFVEAEPEADDGLIVFEVGSALGMALRIALTESDAHTRSVSCHEPVGDALALVAMDIRGHGELVFRAEFQREQIGRVATQHIREFFQRLTSEFGATLHAHKITGTNDQFVCEAIFKGFGKCLCDSMLQFDKPRKPSQK